MRAGSEWAGLWQVPVVDRGRGRSGDWASRASQASREIFANGGSYSSLAAATTVQLRYCGVVSARQDWANADVQAPREGRGDGMRD